MEIKQIKLSRKTKYVIIPIKSDLQVGDYVKIIKIKEEDK